MEESCIKEKLKEISSISSKVKCLSRILYDLLNDNGNLSSHEISTLGGILLEKAENLNENINDLILYLQK